MWTTINAFLKTVDNFVWGVPLMVLILCGGILLTVRLGVLQMRRLPLALKWMIKNEDEQFRKQQPEQLTGEQSEQFRKQQPEQFTGEFQQSERVQEPAGRA